MLQNLAEGDFRRAVRRAIIIREVEASDAEIERVQRNGASILVGIRLTKIMP